MCLVAKELSGGAELFRQTDQEGEKRKKGRERGGEGGRRRGREKGGEREKLKKGAFQMLFKIQQVYTCAGFLNTLRTHVQCKASKG